jgi:hypothetical protein
MDRKMGLMEWFAVRAHLRICIHCRRFTKNMEFLRSAVRRFPGDGE